MPTTVLTRDPTWPWPCEASRSPISEGSTWWPFALATHNVGSRNLKLYAVTLRDVFEGNTNKNLGLLVKALRRDPWPTCKASRPWPFARSRSTCFARRSRNSANLHVGSRNSANLHYRLIGDPSLKKRIPQEGRSRRVAFFCWLETSITTKTSRSFKTNFRQ